MLENIGVAGTTSTDFDRSLLERLRAPEIIDGGAVISVQEFAEILGRLDIDLSGRR